MKKRGYSAEDVNLLKLIFSASKWWVFKMTV